MFIDFTTPKEPHFMTLWLGYCFCLASDRLFITSTQPKFESHFDVGLRDRLWTGFFSPGVRFSKDPKTLRERKAIRRTPTRLFCKAGLFICCKGNKK